MLLLQQVVAVRNSYIAIWHSKVINGLTNFFFSATMKPAPDLVRSSTLSKTHGTVVGGVGKMAAADGDGTANWRVAENAACVEVKQRYSSQDVQRF